MIKTIENIQIIGWIIVLVKKHMKDINKRANR